MYAYGLRGDCVPCGTAGLGAIVMEPLKGGLGQGRAAAFTGAMGAVAPAAAMVGAGLVYGAIGGWAAQDWTAAGNSALMGAGLVGLAGGLGLMGASAAAPEPAPEPGLTGLGTTGMIYTALGAASLAYGAWRSTR